jgi:hypothetical protein
MRLGFFLVGMFLALSYGAHASEPFWSLPDSDSDGVLNTIECPRIRELDDPFLCHDTDGDGVPNVLDEDSDNDGLLDGRDSSPLVPAVRSARSIDAIRADGGTLRDVTLGGLLVGLLGVFVYVRSRTL